MYVSVLTFYNNKGATLRLKKDTPVQIPKQLEMTSVVLQENQLGWLETKATFDLKLASFFLFVFWTRKIRYWIFDQTLANKKFVKESVKTNILTGPSPRKDHDSFSSLKLALKIWTMFHFHFLWMGRCENENESMRMKEWNTKQLWFENISTSASGRM